MIIDKDILDELSAKAKESPRLRVAMDLRNSAEDLLWGRVEEPRNDRSVGQR